MAKAMAALEWDLERSFGVGGVQEADRGSRGKEVGVGRTGTTVTSRDQILMEELRIEHRSVTDLCPFLIAFHPHPSNPTPV